MTPTNVAAAFISSREWQARLGQMNDGQFVRFLYQAVLDREPDPSGFAYWVSIMGSGQASRAHMIILFVDSPELRRTLTDLI